MQIAKEIEPLLIIMLDGRQILVTLLYRNAPTFSRNLAARDDTLIDESTFISPSFIPPRLFLNYSETPNENECRANS